MAQRRMFSMQVVDTDAFLEMPTSTQNLYFHFGMRADDDGFVSNPKKIMKMVGSGEDDLKVLFSKRFILGFDNGIIVIKHWRINNLLRKDRYNETVYLEEKSKLEVKDNNSYTEVKSCQPNGNQLEPQYSIGKVSKDKNSIDKNKYGSLNNVLLSLEEFNKLNNEYGKDIINKYIESLSTYIPNRKKQPYKDHNAVIRNWLNKDNMPKKSDERNFLKDYIDEHCEGGYKIERK